MNTSIHSSEGLQNRITDAGADCHFLRQSAPDKSEGGYSAGYPDLPGCPSCAETIESAAPNAIDAKRERLIAALEEGTAIALPGSLLFCRNCGRGSEEVHTGIPYRKLRLLQERTTWLTERKPAFLSQAENL